VCTCVRARVRGLIPTSLFSPSVPCVTSVGGLLHGWVDTGRGGDRGPHGRTERGTGAGRHNRHRPLPRRPTLHAAVPRQRQWESDPPDAVWWSNGGWEGGRGCDIAAEPQSP
jgi:hypothetical protein